MLEESVVVERDCRSVYRALRDLRLWRRLVRAEADLHVQYDDGIHQVFLLRLQRPGAEQTLRGFRFCFAEHAIEFVQSTPPRGLLRMRGVWRVQALCPNVTQLRATQEFELMQPDRARGAMIERYLRRRLRRQLALFKRRLELDA